MYMATIFKGLWHGDMYNCTCLGQGTWTLYGFTLVSVGQNMGFLQSTVDSVAFKCSERGASSFSTLVEVCSGLGGISVGASYSGFETLLSVDKAAIACETIRLNGGQALEGDISSPRSAAANLSRLSPPRLCASGWLPLQQLFPSGFRARFVGLPRPGAA